MITLHLSTDTLAAGGGPVFQNGISHLYVSVHFTSSNFFHNIITFFSVQIYAVRTCSL
jgi:hypothetical protein